MVTIMFKKILFLALYCSLFTARGIEVVNENAKKLMQTVSEGEAQLSKALDAVNGAEEENEKVVKERSDHLLNFYHKMVNDVKDLVYQQTVQSVSLNNLVEKHSCLARTANNAFLEFNETFRWVPEASNKLKERGMRNVNPCKLVVWACKKFLEEYKEVKLEEIKNLETEEEVQTVLNDALEKVKLMNETANAVMDTVENEKFRFFEDFVNFSFNAENVYKRHKMVGERKIKKCLQ